MADHFRLGTAKSLASNLIGIVEELSQRLAVAEAHLLEAQDIIVDLREENNQLKELAGLTVVHRADSIDSTPSDSTSSNNAFSNSTSSNSTSKNTTPVATTPAAPATTPETALGPPKRCRFLELPGELRNQIYRYAVAEWRLIPTVVTAAYTRTPPRKVYRLKTWQQGLLTACRQIRQEALPMYYAENTFAFSTAGSLPVLSEQWCEDTRQHIKHLRSLILYECGEHVTLHAVKISAEETSGSDINVHIRRGIWSGGVFPDLSEDTLDVVKTLRAPEDCLSDGCEPIGELLWEEMRYWVGPTYKSGRTVVAAPT